MFWRIHEVKYVNGTIQQFSSYDDACIPVDEQTAHCTDSEHIPASIHITVLVRYKMPIEGMHIESM